MRYIFLFILTGFLTVDSTAQVQGNNLSLVLGFGGTSYRGDLSQSFQSWGGTFHAGILFNKKKRTNGYIHFMLGGVRGNNPSYTYNDTATTTPNNYFKTSLFSVGYELRIHILKRASYSLYLSPGVALLRYNPKDEYNNPYSDQFATRARGEEYNNIALMFPIKIGGAYYLQNGCGIGVDAGFLNPMTDYIDNISDWGNRKKKDNLMQINLLLYISINRNTKE